MPNTQLHMSAFEIQFAEYGNTISLTSTAVPKEIGCLTLGRAGRKPAHENSRKSESRFYGCFYFLFQSQRFL